MNTYRHRQALDARDNVRIHDGGVMLSINRKLSFGQIREISYGEDLIVPFNLKGWLDLDSS